MVYVNRRKNLHDATSEAGISSQPLSGVMRAQEIAQNASDVQAEGKDITEDAKAVTGENKSIQESKPKRGRKKVNADADTNA